MLKVIVFLSVLFSSVSFCADDESYIFEAKGKFAKELKALVEKYSKDGKIDVKVIKTSKKKGKNRDIIASLLGSDDKGDVERGREIYNQNCINCHGAKADRNNYVGGKTLNKFSKDKLVDEMENYKRDILYGGSLRYVMYNSVDTLSREDMKSVAEYIVSLKGNYKSPEKSSSSVAVENNTEEESSYLK